MTFTIFFLISCKENIFIYLFFQISVRAYTVIGAGPFVHPSQLIFTGKATAELNKINNMKITKDNAAAVR